MRHLPRLDPEIAAGLARLPPGLDATRGIGAFAMTAAQRAWPAELPVRDGLLVADVSVPVPAERPDEAPGEAPAETPWRVPVRVYRRRVRTAAAGRGVVVLHGGGFISGSPVMADAILQRIAEEFDAVVMAPTYRLAPEHPYPAAFDDALATLHHLADTAGELGVDLDRLVVFGVSSGACLAAALALHCRDHGGPALAAQVLGYPCLDDRLQTPSSHEVHDPRIWNRGMAELSWRAYLAGLDAAAVPATAAPARATDLAGLPAAAVTVDDLDPLRDEGIDYAQRLMQAGVPTELRTFPGTFHGSLGIVPDAVVSRREIAALIGAIGRA